MIIEMTEEFYKYNSDDYLWNEPEEFYNGNKDFTTLIA